MNAFFQKNLIVSRFSFRFNHCATLLSPKTSIVISKTHLQRINLTSKCNESSNNFVHKINNDSSLVIDFRDKRLNSYTYRTHTCGELCIEHVGEKVTICGWLQYSRLNKFLLLRDAYGLIQCVMHSNISIDWSKLSFESIIKVEGAVILRTADTVNKTMSTGEVEVVVSQVTILNEAEDLPFNLRNYQKPKEQLRLQHRYIDLRFPEMQNALRKRSTMLFDMRRFLIERNGFVEVETPTLFCQTPGGAREFVVPTHHQGLFYSLVQSPQQFKQMLMSGSVDRYFQIARCYRDESTRPDRQPEFTQLDIELSFTNRESIIQLIENMLYETFIKELPKPPFKKITFREAIETYGSDKPNLSYDLKLTNIGHLLQLKAGDKLNGAYCIKYSSKLGKLTAKSKDQIRQIAKKYKTKIIFNEKIPIELGEDISSKLKCSNQDVVIALGESDNCCTSLGAVREILADLLIVNNLLILSKEVKPLWVVDFPLFTKGENGNLETCHHPFTAPHPDDVQLLDEKPLEVRSLAYDLVMNGYEVGGGSVRVHNVELQRKLLNMLDIMPESLAHFLNALKYGCPPHAGIALGIDRLMVIGCDAESIRDVIAFPKNHEGKDPLSGAPKAINKEDKQYYHLL